MTRPRYEADYVVVGAGTVGLAFSDVVLAESDRSVIIVDRQARPGGHWNHAYPFVRLHQPSSFYGVASRQLGRNAIDTSGKNAGFYGLATAAEVLSYYEGLLREQFLPSGRVTYLPRHEFREDGTAASLMSNEVVEVRASRKVVDARYLGSVVPAMREHRPSFEVARAARLATPNDLADIDEPYAGYVVIGAGKTSADVCLWLLDNGVEPDQITWVRPRDSWFYNRAVVQPGARFARDTIGGYAAMLEAAAKATSADELAGLYEEAGVFLRIDPRQWPTFYRGATMAPSEIVALRAIDDVVRLGYVTRIDDGAIELARGRRELRRGVLHVDCTAEGLRRRPPVPFFTPGAATLQYAVNGGQVAYSAALAGIVELAFDDDDEKNAHLVPAPITSELGDLARNFLIEIQNQAAWSQVPRIQQWIDHCRLNPAMEALSTMDSGDEALIEATTRVLVGIEPARENLTRLVSEL